MLFKRNRTPTKHIYYALHLHFSGLSLRKVSQHLSPFIKRNLVSIWNWIQHYNKPEKMFHRKRKIYEFIVDETLIKVGNELVWVWIIIAIELKDKTILGIPISYDERRSMLIVEQFMRSLVRKYGKHPVSTDSSGTWYPQACKFLKLIKHHIHLPYEKSIIIERTIFQYVKDRTESFDDYLFSL